MNEQMNSTDLTQTSNALLGFLMGAAVGAGVALLFAPCAGNETRRKLGDKARQWGANMKDQVQNTKGTLNDLKDDVKTAVSSGKDAFSREREQRFQTASPNRYEAPTT